MNQILSVEMPKKNNKTYRKNNGNGKASTKSVIIFFCMILLIFGIAMIGLGVYSKLKDNTEEKPVPTSETDKPRIDISQNASELDIEVTAKSEISKVEYKWNDGELIEENGNGTDEFNISVKIPSGENTFTIKATDINGIENQYSNSYVGPENAEPNANLSFISATNKLKIICEEEQIITSIKYHYDNEDEKTTQVNNTKAEIEIPIKQGKHTLTVNVQYEDGTEKETSKKVYFPIVERVKVSQDMSSFIINASDERKITKVEINFNGEDLPVEQVNSETFEKTLQLKDGENRLILTVYNSDGVSITTRTRWEKK